MESSTYVASSDLQPVDMRQDTVPFLTFVYVSQAGEPEWEAGAGGTDIFTVYPERREESPTAARASTPDSETDESAEQLRRAGVEAARKLLDSCHVHRGLPPSSAGGGVEADPSLKKDTAVGSDFGPGKYTDESVILQADSQQQQQQLSSEAGSLKEVFSEALSDVVSDAGAGDRGMGQLDAGIEGDEAEGTTAGEKESVDDANSGPYGENMFPPVPHMLQGLSGERTQQMVTVSVNP